MRALLLLCCLSAACASSKPQPVSAHHEPPPVANPATLPLQPEQDPSLVLEQRELVEGWSGLPHRDFEELVRRLSEEQPAWSWAESSREELRRGLDSGLLELAVRAAVLLAHSTGSADAEVLLQRLEARHLAEARNSDAADVVAAAALAACADAAGRLERLAVGSQPHPDLEVRVECAASALRLGRRAVAPLLLRVLRAGTPEEARDPIDWTPTETMAWAKSRAAEALEQCLQAGVRYRPDASFDDQRSWIAAFARVLAERTGAVD